MPSEKRQRQDEARLNKRVAQQSASKRDQRNSTLRTVAIIVGVLVVGAFLYSALTGGKDKKDDVATGSTTSSVADGSSTTSPSKDIAVTYPGKGAAVTGDTPCPKADGTSERTTSFAKAPPTCIAKGKTYTAKVTTTEGTFTIALDSAKAPIAVNNFVVLARYHFYDGIPFHRIIPGFVDQAGTPVLESSPDGQATPGYTIADELPDSASTATAADVYPEGTLAVANTGSPNTGSSQFFVVVGSGGSQLGLTYTPFGKVASGLDVVQAINKFGDAATNGVPTKQITITAITITES